MEPERQAEAGRIDVVDHRLEPVGAEAGDMKHRPEILGLEVADRSDLDDRRRDETAPCAIVGELALPHPAPGGAHRGDVGIQRIFCLGVDNRADIGRQSARIAHIKRFIRTFYHCQHAVRDVVLEV